MGTWTLNCTAQKRKQTVNKRWCYAVQVQRWGKTFGKEKSKHQDPVASGLSLLVESQEGWTGGEGLSVEGEGADTHGCSGYSEKFKISLTALGSSGKYLAIQTHHLFLMSYLEIIIDSQDIVNIVQSIFHLISHMVIAYITLITKSGIWHWFNPQNLLRVQFHIYSCICVVLCNFVPHIDSQSRYRTFLAKGQRLYLAPKCGIINQIRRS